ncbi:hypothetical protein Verru16b_00610 [Lacunisphaera limnophila]|uniref:Uncharacterized protein n=1 Tax=Lacunisphaera limnophila TaxID=1838286 RepID=A0A1D8ARP6_9BACT|nr:hypothetical protein [Lacunisphaera limnophila]AOS43563.1 hypothetical protein Verru16b_00610 [Lacunisphaera limnophila]
MSPFFPPSARVWLGALLVALGFTIWVDARRIERLDHIAALTRSEAVPSPASPTGYTGQLREWVLPDHEGRSSEWITQAQHLLAGGDWRVRHVTAENAPHGRPSHATAPYRAWLALVARGHQLLTGQPAGIAVERAARYADPLLHLLLLTGVTLFAARHFGPGPAVVAALAGATLFPFAASFAPGVPDDSSLGLLCAVGSLLPLIAGLCATARVASTPRGFAVAGVFGGLGCWINPAAQIPLLLGLAGGALLAAWLRRTGAPLAPLPWRIWSISGAITVLLASLIEFFPDHLGAWEMRAVHPLYGLAWLGGGELLARASRWIEGGRASWHPRELGPAVLALAALLSVPGVMIITGNPGFLAADLLSLRLTRLPDAPLAANLDAWLREDGFNAALFATLAPLLVTVAALALVARRGPGSNPRPALAVLLGAGLVTFALATLQLKSWALFDVTVLALLLPLVASAAGLSRGLRLIGSALLLAVCLSGAWQLLPPRHAATDNSLTVAEALGLAERDLAHWLAQRRPAPEPVVVLAPPNLTTTLNYYGNLQGLGTLSWENQTGLDFAVRIAISTSRAETIALLRQRGVTHIVLPSWDLFFDPYLQAASIQTGELFYRSLNRWALPPWLRPVPYQLPAIPGFEKQYVRIFAVGEDQEAPVAASRVTEYFIEQGEWDNARASHQTLLKYPADFGVLVARARLWAALNDAANFTPVFEPLLQRLAAGADRYLPWDRRVSLALVLARGNQLPLARVQAERCLAEISEDHLRTLPTNVLYQLLYLNRSFGLEIADPRLRALALELLPAKLRAGL